jgi:hypothetical protein
MLDPASAAIVFISRREKRQPYIVRQTLADEFPVPSNKSGLAKTILLAMALCSRSPTEQRSLPNYIQKLCVCPHTTDDIK